ncbi:MAG: type IV toxin-antitoxin system AbiEi family antitoxin, partial [Acidimicrobiales bacterium]
LLTQLALRPASFRVWSDLVPRIDELAADCDLNLLTELLTGQSMSAWQRACYVLDCGGQRPAAITLLRRRPARRLAKVQFGSGQEIVYVHEFGIIDSIIGPARQGGRPRSSP